MTQASKPDLYFREPFTWDLCYKFLNKTALHPLALLAIPLLGYALDRHSVPNPAVYPPLTDWQHVKGLLFSADTSKPLKWLGRLFILVAVKSISNALTRYTRNHGEWRADKPNWKEEVVVITGGASGIGKATVEILSHEKRAKIAVLDMGPPLYAPAPAGAPEILYFKTDVTKPEQVKAAAEQIRAKHGEPTILMNCAGIASGNLILETTMASAERIWKINTLSHWITVQEFLPYMIKKNHGHILSVASAAAYMSLPQLSEYAMTKSGALSFQEVLRGELNARYHAKKVRTSVCCPTKVYTPLADGMEDHNMPFLTPNLMPIQVGRAIVAAFDSGLSQDMVMPEALRTLPAMRGLPFWFKRGFQLLGHTDNQVTSKTMQRAAANGYGKSWEGDDAVLRDAMLKALETKK